MICNARFFKMMFMELLVFKYTALAMTLKNRRNWLAIYRLLKLSIRKKSAISGALTSNDHSASTNNKQNSSKKKPVIMEENQIVIRTAQ